MEWTETIGILVRTRAPEAPTIGAQCDDGQTPCDPPRPREALDVSVIGSDPVFAPECDMPLYVSTEHWDRLFYAAEHEGPTCTVSEAT